MPKDWKIYSLSPIDSDWSVVPAVGEFVASKLSEMLPPSDTDAPTLGDVISELESIYSFCEIVGNLRRVLLAAGHLDKRLRIAPRILWFPGDTEFAYGFVWKIDSNGETFVAVPHPIVCPWLSDFSLVDEQEIHLEQY